MTDAQSKSIEGSRTCKILTRWFFAVCLFNVLLHLDFVEKAFQKAPVKITHQVSANEVCGLGIEFASKEAPGKLYQNLLTGHGLLPSSPQFKSFPPSSLAFQFLKISKSLQDFAKIRFLKEFLSTGPTGLSPPENSNC
ncbi:MAG TPA: hypothetical protein DCL41_08595 [Bdellovibrionales bacterium]|nr:hypothetical protein [Pseudobdellovibrionaceae bacterium]HAG91916.1 hypothetical protein [Bdellovibrionales bacterium]|tara:strand:- start:3008 stop:3421 length:414 start_codon:yes stop_codon:yes gene_type:complete